MEDNEKLIYKDNAEKIELNDDSLDIVSGGITHLKDPVADASSSEISDFLCACPICGADTSWNASDDGLTVFCAACGVKKDRVWFDSNKIRKRGIIK